MSGLHSFTCGGVSGDFFFRNLNWSAGYTAPYPFQGKGTVKFFSTNNSSIVPVKVYDNADSQKSEIVEENNGKSGIYRRVNKETQKQLCGI